MKAQSVPAAIEYLRSLHRHRPSPSLTADLCHINTAKDRSLAMFKEGVTLFTQIANLSSAERTDYYGNELGGLHYNNDLARLWNKLSSFTIEPLQLNRLCPDGWDYQIQDGFSSLIFRGPNISRALDRLLQGPTVIDCGMFTQLSIWFGIKYILGEEVFNTVFGRAPFYLTQLVYNPSETLEPYKGNPLFSFFQSEASLGHINSDSVSIEHVRNHRLYQLKHPGGNYGGENCVVINGRYTVFDPELQNSSHLERSDVESLLLDAFNQEQDENDRIKIQEYSNADGSVIHPQLGMCFDNLITMARTLSGLQADNIEHNAQASPLRIAFDFPQFCSWVSSIESPEISGVDYQPCDVSQNELPVDLLNEIPYENRHRMSFDQYVTATPLQRQIKSTALKFCQDVMNKRSVCVVLTGKAGIGKTASAVSCAKELRMRGKRVVWFTEVMLTGWLDKAKTMEDINACCDEVRKRLSDNPDAVFLDDDNLVGYAGKVLLEEIYKWYAINPGKGLFITSNEPLSFKDCYGYKLDKIYHFPPFVHYDSPQYRNSVHRAGLNGRSMRARPQLGIMQLSAHERVSALLDCEAGSSVGIILQRQSYDSEQKRLGDVEFVPAFPRGTFVPMTQSLMSNGTLGPQYERLTADQKNYTKRFPVTKEIRRGRMIVYTGQFWYRGIYIRWFDTAHKKTIVVELIDGTHWQGHKIVDEDCVRQVLRVVNFAHDSGGKRVVLLNNTSFTNTEMINEIKAQIPEREQERTLARISALFFLPSLRKVNQAEQKSPSIVSEKKSAQKRSREVGLDFQYNSRERYFSISGLQRTAVFIKKPALKRSRELDLGFQYHGRKRTVSISAMKKKLRLYPHGEKEWQVLMACSETVLKSLIPLTVRTIVNSGSASACLRAVNLVFMMQLKSMSDGLKVVQFKGSVFRCYCAMMQRKLPNMNRFVLERAGHAIMLQPWWLPNRYKSLVMASKGYRQWERRMMDCSPCFQGGNGFLLGRVELNQDVKPLQDNEYAIVLS